MIYISDMEPVCAPEELRISYTPKTSANSAKVRSVPFVPSPTFPPTL
jgi:hypothetical protein